MADTTKKRRVYNTRFTFADGMDATKLANLEKYKKDLPVGSMNKLQKENRSDQAG